MNSCTRYDLGLLVGVGGKRASIPNTSLLVDLCLAWTREIMPLVQFLKLQRLRTKKPSMRAMFCWKGLASGQCPWPTRTMEIPGR